MNLIRILDEMRGKKVLVIGDLMLDKFILGDVSRISPEAPVPIVKVEEENIALGGAGNVANNISSLGGISIIAGVVGDDEEAEILLQEFKKRKINVDCVLKNKTRPTIQKIRIMDNSQHILRLDYEKTTYVEKEIENKLLVAISKKIPEIEAIIISDYAKGAITKNLAKKIIEGAKKNKKLILVDTKPKHVDFYNDITLIKPNIKEAKEMTSKDDLNDIGNELKKKFNSNILITRGKDGMSLFLKTGKRIDVRTRAREIADISGAGDTVIAVLSLALVAGAGFEDAINLSNIAAGLVVEKSGVVPVDFEELKTYLKENKL